MQSLFGVITHPFLSHEHLLQRELTSIHEGRPITGRLPFFGKWNFDPYFILRSNMANFVAALEIVTNFVLRS